MTQSASPAAPDVWTVLSMILWSAEYLEGKGVPNARLDSEHLLAHVVEADRLQLYLDFERPLSRSELDAYRPLLKRRASREPLQYIIGSQPFRELEVQVRPGVLIPRPETEALVEGVLDWARAHERRGAALDIGTGSGVIALSLAGEGAFEWVLATDVDEGAIEIANENTAGVEGRVDFRLGSLFDPIEPDERFDVIVSNPPYIREVDAEGLEPEVRDWEPRTALFAGDDGLAVIRPLVEGAASHLAPGGLVALEVGLGQARDVAGLFEAADAFGNVRILRDYSGRERFVFAVGA